MHAIIALFGFTLLLVFALTPVARAVAVRCGAVDRPGDRSVHRHPIPFLGGVVIYFAFALGVLILEGFTRNAAGVLAGGAVVTLLGLWDDSGKAYSFHNPSWLFEREGRGLRPWVKLVGQVLAAVVLVGFGVRIEWIRVPLFGYVYLDLWGVLATVVWVVCVTNVMNLMDGLDGLAAGVTAIAALTLLIVGMGQPGSQFAALLLAALLGCCVGFLPWNWEPARIFLGDAGAMFLGFALGATAVEGTLKGPAVVALAVPVLAIGVPVFDTSLAVVRRWRGRRPIGAADRGHLHHRLLALGIPQRDVVLLMYLASGWLAISALAVDHLDAITGGIILLFVVLTLVLAAKRLGVLRTEQH